MIEKLKPMLKNAKFVVFTMTDLGEKVRISAVHFFTLDPISVNPVKIESGRR